MEGDYYYTLAEAAEFIASKTGKKKNIKDVLRDATNGKVRLCVQFDGELSKFSIINETITCEDDYRFVGYIQIPKEKISINNEGDIQFTRAGIVEITRLYYKNRDPLSIKDNEWLAKKHTQSLQRSRWERERHTESTKPQCDNFRVNIWNDAVIPEQDLLDFIAQNQVERSLTNKDTSAIKITPESISILGRNKSIGRPKSIEKNARILKQIIESLTDGKMINHTKLPGRADNLLEACKRIAQAKSKKNMFSISLGAFKKWLKAAGYGFGNGRTPTNEKNYWTDLGAKNIEKIDQKVFC